jgi:nucleoid DNA-binding protein
MPRQVVEYTPCRTTTCWRPNRRKRFVYGARVEDLVDYLSEKYGIKDTSARAIVRDVFRYILAEVLSGKEGTFTIPMFGRFFRAVLRHGTFHKGMVLETVSLRFKPSRNVSWNYLGDPEWVDPDEVEGEEA